MIDPAALATRDEPNLEGPAEEEVQPQPEALADRPPPEENVIGPVAEPAPQNSLPADTQGELAVRAGASLTSGVLPRAAWAVHVAAEGVLLGPLRWGVGVRFYPEVKAESSDFAFGLSAAFVSMCLEAQPNELTRIGVCASPMFGAVHAVVFEPSPTVPGDRGWIGLSTLLSASIKLGGQFWLSAELGGMWSILGQTFTVGGRETPAFSQDILGIDASLSLVSRFP